MKETSQARGIGDETIMERGGEINRRPIAGDEERKAGDASRYTPE